MLAIFEPKALPNANDELPLAAAVTETTNSGDDVPNPTTTIPINKGGIPKYRATTAEPSTNLLAL